VGQSNAERVDRSQLQLGRDLVEITGQFVEIPAVEIVEQLCLARIIDHRVQVAGDRMLLGVRPGRPSKDATTASRKRLLPV